MPVLTTPSVKQIAQAISGQLTAAGIRAVDYLADTFTPPVALVGIDTVDYHVAFGFEGLYTFTVFLIVARAADRAGIAALEDFMSNASATSIRATLEADQSLGGVTETCMVLKSGPPAAVNIGAQNPVPYMSVPFVVEVRA